MPSTATAHTSTLPALSLTETDFALQKLRVFRSIPVHHHDVVALQGYVVVYETDGLCCEEIQDGALYVVENQRPVGGMGWETYDRFNREHEPCEPRVRISTSRRVVRVIRRAGEPKRWWHVLPTGYHDGPYADWGVAHSMVGKVVGIYQPNLKTNCRR
ncbi:hypothetical protein U8326_00050 [Tsuneonella sp. CC-YZS046]|uniref:hypothetical protein n=1 Tax=Tsuneonella sp. CC-YZS046 TaxID=3042152 RepID=UPI002D77D957|nr:hypothetical protein [Tsuneonella sp. CC-YZS046]WRO66596.1 hypothetical protein U8326_00050 [Tsuneonella sp. CC-YZS046]